MKLKLILITSLINTVIFFSGYALFIKPAQQHYKMLRIAENKQTSALERLQQISQALAFKLKRVPKLKAFDSNQLIQTLSQIAKQQTLNIQQATPLKTHNEQSGASFVLTGSYQSALIFIYRVNQLPFLLHWSSIVMQKLQNTLEITVHIQKNE